MCLYRFPERHSICSISVTPGSQFRVLFSPLQCRTFKGQPSPPTLSNNICLYHMKNRWMRKSIVVAAPNLPFVGFGVCPVTNDPKIVSVTQSSWDESEVMVYTLSSGKWRSLTSNLPTQPLHDWLSVVVTDRFVYWCVELPNQNMIMSFDVINESFESIDLPDSLATRDLGDLYISKVRESCFASIQRRQL
ncbi:unnamed protein product [Lactuca virosa]|uniref:F-box associated beta-propeller type 3 domain-containing protein n=1 Tax=Lactuca virosa TaxID=75947 RepID=A0AAU9PCH9_9ASTR|nr:unnamed protein product [Lactuca virosa]